MSVRHIVIVGAGFGGLTVAQKLKRLDANITVVDRANHHLFQPLLYQVATSALGARDIAYPIREILKYQENTRVLMDELTTIDVENKHLEFASGRHQHYDALVLAVGITHSYFGSPEWETFAPGLKTLEDARRLREKILISFEKAESSGDTNRAQELLTFVVVGAGPTGVEIAGALAEIAQRTMLKNFRRIDPSLARVILIEGSDRVLPQFPEPLGVRAKKDLEDLGVEVWTETMVQDITADGVQLSDRFVPSENVIWAAGNRGLEVMQQLPTERDRMGRIFVEEDLTVSGYPDVFVIGDAAHVPGKNDQALPGIAPVAIQQGKYAAKTLIKNIPKEKRKPFVYWDKGQMATIGKARAVGVIGGRYIYGLFAWLIWSIVHVAFLVGFRSRLTVMTEWIYYYFTESRASRLIFRPSTEHLPEAKESEKEV